MKAIVVQIESGSKFTDKERRIEITFPDADLGFYHSLKFAESKLGPFAGGLKLDDVLDVSIVTERELGEFKRQLREDESDERQRAARVMGLRTVRPGERDFSMDALIDAENEATECTCNGKSLTAVNEHCPVHNPRGSKQEGCAS